MATSPKFPQMPNVSWCVLNTENVNTDGTGDNVIELFEAGSQGSRVDRIKAMPNGTIEKTVLRIFFNNGEDRAVADNNILALEKSILAAQASTNQALAQYEEFVDWVMPGGYKLYASIGNATTEGGLAVFAMGGDY